MDVSSVKGFVRGCKRCALHKTCTLPVPLDGAIPCNLLVVGEAPGAEEDKQNRPFVGAAGNYLRGVLREVGFQVYREVAWCNVIACRPPNNRDPYEDEIRECRDNLELQIVTANPRVILLVGKFAVRALRPDWDKISHVRGTLMWIRSGQVAIPTFHPAAVLRRKQWAKELEGDCRMAHKFARGERVEWPGDCVVCGGMVEKYDWMGVPYCVYHTHLVNRVINAPVQERLML